MSCGCDHIFGLPFLEVGLPLLRGNPFDLTGQKLLTRFLELLTYNTEIVLKSDGEHSLVKLKKAAGREAKNLTKVVCEESPAGDLQANGEAEAAVREIKWRIKAVHLMLEKKLDGGLPEGHPLALWIARYVAEQSNRYKVGADGRTPEERRTGKKWIKPMPVFGEKIFVKPAGKGKKTDVSKMKEARFLGCHMQPLWERLGHDEGGCGGWRWIPHTGGCLEEDLKGSPWDVRAYVRRAAQEELLPAPSCRRSLLELRDILAKQAWEKKEQKAWPLRRDHLVWFGRTAGCPGCLSILKGAGFQQVAHNDDCRSRIKQCLAEQSQTKAEETKRLRAEDAAEEAARGGSSVAMEHVNPGGEASGSRDGVPVVNIDDQPMTTSPMFYEQHVNDYQAVALSDSDGAGDLRSRKSTTGTVVKTGNHTVLVKGATQKVVALSSRESKFIWDAPHCNPG